MCVWVGFNSYQFMFIGVIKVILSFLRKHMSVLLLTKTDNHDTKDVGCTTKIPLRWRSNPRQASRFKKLWRHTKYWAHNLPKSNNIKAKKS